MARTPDGGGSDGFPHTSYYDPGEIHGGGSGDGGSGPSAESGLSNALHDVMVVAMPVSALLGGGGGDVRSEVEKAMKGSNPDGLKAKAQIWSQVSTKASGYSTKLSGAISKITGAWEGDDADQATKILQGLYATVSSQSTHAANMSSALANMGANLQSVKDSYGHDESTMGGIGNYFSGSDDRGAASAYKSLMTNFQENLGIMPKTVPTEIKSGAASSSISPPPPPPKTGGAGGAPSVGGPGSAAHGANPTPAHIQQPTLHHPTTTDPNTTDPTWKNPDYTDPTGNDPGLNNGGTDPNGPGGVSPYSGGGGGIGVPGGSGAGLDTGGSLAGLGGAGGGLGAGGGGLGAGDASGVGAGAGALNGGLGAGAGAGSSAGGSGLGAGAGTPGGAVGAAGGRGMMMPMHGAGQGDEDERERSTWLSEDEDVWGNEDDVPTVIS
jgi:hypothetical protein